MNSPLSSSHGGVLAHTFSFGSDACSTRAYCMFYSNSVNLKDVPLCRQLWGLQRNFRERYVRRRPSPLRSAAGRLSSTIAMMRSGCFTIDNPQLTDLKLLFPCLGVTYSPDLQAGSAVLGARSRVLRVGRARMPRRPYLRNPVGRIRRGRRHRRQLGGMRSGRVQRGGC